MNRIKNARKKEIQKQKQTKKIKKFPHKRNSKTKGIYLIKTFFNTVQWNYFNFNIKDKHFFSLKTF